MSIPGLPGVPPLATTLKRNLISTAPVALFDATIGKANQVWGVFDSKGNRILWPDTFVGLTFRNYWRISDYPVEQGSFSSYNKVKEPYDAIVTVAKGGTQSERAKFAQSVESLGKSITPYAIITPDETFGSVVIERFTYERRAEQGANLLIVHLHCREVRQTASIQYTQTKSGAPINSTVPVGQQTQTTTSTGIASATSTVNPSSQGVVNQGAVSTSTTAASLGTIQ